MNLFRKFDQQEASRVSFGVRTLLISPEGTNGKAALYLAGLGSLIECETELYAGLDLAICDPAGYGLIVIECDRLGGLEAGRRARAMLEIAAQNKPMILISAECVTQEFPLDRFAPIVLRAPLSAISLRVGFEHALRDRLMMAQAS